jgi:hypothetical protein
MLMTWKRDPDTGLILRKSTGELMCNTCCDPCPACAPGQSPAFVSIKISGVNPSDCTSLRLRKWSPGADSVNGIFRVPYYYTSNVTCVYSATFCGNYGSYQYYYPDCSSPYNPPVNISTFSIIIELYFGGSGSITIGVNCYLGSLPHLTFHGDKTGTRPACVDAGSLPTITHGAGLIDGINIEVLESESCAEWIPSPHRYYPGDCVSLGEWPDRFYLCSTGNVGQYPSTSPDSWEERFFIDICGRP